MGGLACLPMYDFPWTASANDALWKNLSARLKEVSLPAPEELTRNSPLAHMWRDPALIFGQTCGYPLWRGLREQVRVVATPIYNFEGCEGPSHCSFIIARRDDRREALKTFRGARAAINGRDSNTGMNLFRAAIARVARGRPFFSKVFLTGAHAESLAEVANGRAQIAAIDCVSFALLARGRPDLTDVVKIVARTPSSPALPFIANGKLSEVSLRNIRQCLFATLSDVTLKESLAVLGLAGAHELDAAAYARVGEIEAEAAELGYPELA